MSFEYKMCSEQNAWFALPEEVWYTIFMPLENFQKISTRTEKQKSSKEKPNAVEAIRQRVRGIMNREKNENHNKIIQDTRRRLEKLVSQITARKAPQKKEKWGKDGDATSRMTYKWLGGTAVQNADGTMKMKVLGLKFGNKRGEITIGAMHESQWDLPWGEVRGTIGIGLGGKIVF